LHLACIIGHKRLYDIALKLIDKGANVNAKDKVENLSIMI